MKSTWVIKKSRDFIKVYEHGTPFADKNLVIYKKRNNSNNVRFGFSVSKKLGKAVRRNRVKRILKEICRLNRNKIKPGYDIVIIARKASCGKSYMELEKSFLFLLKKIDLFLGENNE